MSGMKIVPTLWVKEWGFYINATLYNKEDHPTHRGAWGANVLNSINMLLDYAMDYCKIKTE